MSQPRSQPRTKRSSLPGERNLRDRKVFQFTCVDRDLRQSLMRDAQKLGGTWLEREEFVPQATHLVCSKPTRSEKFLGFLISGGWILPPQYIKDSCQAKAWLNEEDYEWSVDCKYLPPGVATNEELLAAPRRWRHTIVQSESKPFQGWICGLLVNDSTKKNTYRRLLEHGGAKIVPIKGKLSVKERDSLDIVLCGTNQLKAARPLIEQGVSCVKAQYLGKYLTQVHPPRIEDFSLLDVDRLLENNGFIDTLKCTGKKLLMQIDGRGACIPIGERLPVVLVNNCSQDSNDSQQRTNEPSTSPVLSYNKTSNFVKRKVLQDNDLSPVLPKTKRPRTGSQDSSQCSPPLLCTWIPLTCDLSTSSSVNATRLSTAHTNIIHACFEEGHYGSAIERLLVSVNRQAYPHPKTLHLLMKMLKDPDVDRVLALNAYSALRMVTSLHPPMNSDLQTVYLQALRGVFNNNERDSAPEWNILSEALNQPRHDLQSATSEGEGNDHVPAQHLLMTYFVALLEHDFKFYIDRFQSNTSNTPLASSSGPMIASILWPKCDGRSKGSVNSMVRGIFDAMVSWSGLQPTQWEVVELIQALVSMTAVHLYLLDAGRSAGGHSQVNGKSVHFARSLAHVIQAELMPNSEVFERVLETLQPSWLRLTVCETILDSYDERLVSPAAAGGPLTLQKIVSTYLYLVPPDPHMSEPSTPVSKPSIFRTPVKCTLTIPNPTNKVQASPGSPSMKRPTNVNKKNAKGETVLHTCCIRNNVPRLQYLLTVPGVDVNAQDNFGWSPLHEAAHFGHIECVRELVQFTPPISKCHERINHTSSALDFLVASQEGITPLHDAVENDHTDVARLILKYGGSKLLMAKTTDGRTPLDMSKNDGMNLVLLDTSEDPQNHELPNTQCYSQGLQQTPCPIGHIELHYQPTDESYSCLKRTVSDIECDNLVALIFNLLVAYYRMHVPSECAVDGEVCTSNTVLSETRRQSDVRTRLRLDVHLDAFQRHLNKISDKGGVSEINSKIELLKALLL